MEQIHTGNLTAFSSVITLTEVLIQPLRLGKNDLVKAYEAILTNSVYFTLAPVSLTVAKQAAYLRAKYNLRTPDALQIASALETTCDAFLTNDRGLLRVTELKIILIDDLDEPLQQQTTP